MNTPSSHFPPLRDKLARDRRIVNGARLQSLIGSGTVGRVYKAVEEVDDGNNRYVAIKIVDFHFPGNDAVLIREAQILQNLNHENIVKLYKFYKNDNSLIMHMEFVDGCTMSDLMHTTDVIEEEDRKRFLSQLSSAIRYLHSKRIVHGDLHLENIMCDRDGNIKVIDFGDATRNESTDPRTMQNDRQNLNTIETILKVFCELRQLCRRERNLNGNNANE